MLTLPVRGDRHTWLVDVGLAAVLAGLFVPIAADVGETSGYGWLWFAAVHVPLCWRRHAPVIVFWSVAVLVFPAAEFALGPSLLVVPMVAIYAVGRYRPRRYLWPIMALLVPVTVMWLWNDGEWWDIVGLVALFAASALLGTYLQTRRAYLAELEDRARRLERERDQQARLAVAAERNRIAREMHDIVAHNLAVMVALADGAVVTTPAAPERAADMMEKASATGREALGEIRRLVGLLRDSDAESAASGLTANGVPAGAHRGGPAVDGGSPVGPQPGFNDVDALIDQVRAAGLRVALTQEGEPGPWGPGAGLAVYRIVQEALTNTMKHAGPRAKAEVSLRYTASGVDVEIVDDGADRGVSAADRGTGGGHGLAGMAERAASYGGWVEAGPRTGTGWRVRASIAFDDGVPA